MPPKIYKKPQRDQLVPKPSSQSTNDKTPLFPQKWDLNMKHIAQNDRTMQYVHILTSILAGIVSGLFNSNIYSGIFAYIGFHVLITVMIGLEVKKLEQYFLKKTDPLYGIATGIMVFICAWIITFNIVYTL